MSGIRESPKKMQFRFTKIMFLKEVPLHTSTNLCDFYFNESCIQQNLINHHKVLSLVNILVVTIADLSPSRVFSQPPPPPPPVPPVSLHLSKKLTITMKFCKVNIFYRSDQKGIVSILLELF